ncbi:MAG: hypothetical protein JRJ80_18070, partial [Deltaproteobacteria bacterium]|nr:hypothetical protein [Deltaproteobacteria bacterium]
MSQVLTVPTHFNDLGELSEGFLDRVEQDTLILYGPVAYEDGSEIEFVVLLADGSPALEGVGRVRAAVDGGADRVPETRYDVVVEALQLDGRSEVVFERLVLARQAVSDHPPTDDAEPPTGDIDVAPSDDELSSEPDTVPPDEEEPDTVPPTASDAPDTVPPAASDEDDDEEYEYDDEPATVIAAVDAEAMMVEAEAVSEAAAESVPATESVAATAAESVPAAESVSEPAPELEFGEEDDVEVEATMSDASDWDEQAVASDEPASDEEAAASGELAP